MFGTLLTAVRTGFVSGIHILTIQGLQLALGCIVLWIALKMTDVNKESQRAEPPFLRLLVMIVLSDLAVSIDSVMSLAIISRDLRNISIGVFFSLAPLLLLLPLITKVMSRVP